MLFLTFQGNDCVIGKYLSEANAGTYPCTPCPNGTTTKDDGANALTLCIPKPCGEEWTLVLLEPQDITASAGVTVMQGSVIGTLKIALTGTSTNSIVIKTAPGVTFVATASVVIKAKHYKNPQQIRNVYVTPGILAVLQDMPKIAFSEPLTIGFPEKVTLNKLGCINPSLKVSMNSLMVSFSLGAAFVGTCFPLINSALAPLA